MSSTVPFLLVGLGNPGKNYQYTRHNVGFSYLDFLAKELNFSFQQKKDLAVATASIASHPFVFLKPLQYMNVSGLAVRKTKDYYKIPSENIIVCYDDVDFDFKDFRLKYQGSAGGHNGIKSIIQNLTTPDFLRLRIGIGSKEKIPLDKYVLSKFTKTEISLLEKEVFPFLTQVLEGLVKDGMQKTMSLFNGPKN